MKNRIINQVRIAIAESKLVGQLRPALARIHNNGVIIIIRIILGSLTIIY